MIYPIFVLICLAGAMLIYFGLGWAQRGFRISLTGLFVAVLIAGFICWQSVLAVKLNTVVTLRGDIVIESKVLDVIDIFEENEKASYLGDNINGVRVRFTLYRKEDGSKASAQLFEVTSNEYYAAEDLPILKKQMGKFIDLYSERINLSDSFIYAIRNGEIQEIESGWSPF